jgi:hypothetical protein
VGAAANEKMTWPAGRRAALRERIMSISTLSRGFKKAHSERDDKKCEDIAREIVSTPADTIDEMLDKIFAAYWLAGLRPNELYNYKAEDNDAPGLQALTSLRVDLETLANKIADVHNVAGDLLRGRFRGPS